MRDSFINRLHIRKKKKNKLPEDYKSNRNSKISLKVITVNKQAFEDMTIKNLPNFLLVPTRATSHTIAIKADKSV